MTLPDYLFISSGDGALYDTRDDGWSNRRPLRQNYRRGGGQIESLSDVKAILRGGSSTDLGGYPLYFITRDGAALSFDAVREQFRKVADDFAHDVSTGWRIGACAINYEDSNLVCDHTGARIPSAYGEDDPEEVRAGEAEGREAFDRDPPEYD